MIGHDYLQLIASRDVTAFSKSALTVFPNFTTLNQSYSDKLNAMKADLSAYFKDNTLTRPFLYLVLGAPGAGKSYLLKKLVEQLQLEDGGPIEYQTINVSEVLDPREIHRLYDKIQSNNVAGVKTVTLFDEVDVKWSDGAAIKYLINPIYDGKYWNGSTFCEFGRCAFFFAGSYLQDRETLVKTHRLLTGIDLSRFLLDLYLSYLRRGDLEASTKTKQALDFCHVQQRWRAHADPRTDTILYLRNLDKIRDFLSRIAGNVLEMIDVSAPLHVTQEAFVLSANPEARSVQASPRLRPVEIVRTIKTIENANGAYLRFTSADEALIQYKNVLLCERLLRAINALQTRFGDSDKGQKGKKKRESKTKKTPKKVERLWIRRAVLNYLAVSPLINGMRSLEQLVNKLHIEKRVITAKPSAFKEEEIAMMVHAPAEFEDPTSVWWKLTRQNPKLGKLLGRTGGSENTPILIQAPANGERTRPSSAAHRERPAARRNGRNPMTAGPAGRDPLV